MLKKAAITSSALFLSAMANASGGYIGVSAGQTDFGLPDFDDGNSFAITGGYRINESFAVEASYLDLGKAKDDIAPVWTIEGNGFNFSAVGIIPVNETFDIFGKVGIFVWDMSLHEAGYGELVSDDGADISLGFGASANLTEKFSVLFEYQKLDLNDETISNLSIGARFNF